ncbi:TPA: hypothetical protein RQK38_000521 [Vibrio vulnificus]|nr:hypothetical protein [Vibrio vulnificus]
MQKLFKDTITQYQLAMAFKKNSIESAFKQLHQEVLKQPESNQRNELLRAIEINQEVFVLEPPIADILSHTDNESIILRKMFEYLISISHAEQAVQSLKYSAQSL